MRIRSVLVALATSVTIVGAPPAVAQTPWPPDDCRPAGGVTGPGDLPTGTVACLWLDSGAAGGPVPFAFHLPAACTAEDPCPVIYLLHGFGGDYTSMLGAAADPSAWVAALTTSPTADPAEVADPWSYSDPATWVTAPPLDVILVAPHGRTVPGGFGPTEGLDSFWTDWNPRYAEGGDEPSYDTPPPAFESMLFDELLPYVDATFPTVASRDWRGLSGVSLGGYGSYLNGLLHPDRFATVGSVSGAMNFLFAAAPPDAPSGPVPGGAVTIPGIVGGAPLPPGPAQGFAVALTALGDPVADQPYYRGHMPVDLARNGRAFADEAPALHLRAFTNDAVPRRGEDLNGPGFFTAEGFEAIVLPMNLAMDEAFEAHGVTRTFEIHPGLHSGVYWNAWLRTHLEAQASRLAPHGSPPPAPDVFDHRTIAASFTIFGWSFVVEDRNDPQFLDLTDVTCDGLTLRGTGRVTVTAPAACGTGVDGDATFVVDLGASGPLVFPTGTDVAARTETVTLGALPQPASEGGGGPALPEPLGDPLPTTGGGAVAGALLALVLVGVRRR